MKIAWVLVDGVDTTLGVKLDYTLIKSTNVYTHHVFIKSIIRYLGIFIGGLIFYFYSKKKQENTDKDLSKIIEKKVPEEKNDKNLQGNKLKIEFLHYDYFSENYESVKFNVITVVILYFLSEEMINALSSVDSGKVNFFMIEIIFMMYFEYKILKMKIEKHQKASVVLICIFCLSLQIASACIQVKTINCTKSLKMGLTLEQCKYVSKLENNAPFVLIIHKFGKDVLVFLIVFYILSMMTSAFVAVKQKWLMDNRFLSPYYILIVIGLSGFIFSILLEIAVSFIGCGDKGKNICTIPYRGIIDNNFNYFFDNIFEYFNDMKNKIRGINDNGKFNKDIKTQAFMEILLVYPLYMVVNFGNAAMEILVIKYLHPTYLILINVLYNLALKIIIFEYEGSKKDYYIRLQLIIKEISYAIAVFCYLIYLEIIELRFCDYDKNIKERIIDRGIKETLSVEIEGVNDTLDLSDEGRKTEMVNYSITSSDNYSEK